MKTPDPQLTAFAQLAAGFCAWCEGESLGPTPARTAASWLCLLHQAALTLDQGSGEDVEVDDVQPEAVARVKGNLNYFKNCYYREFFDPDPALIDSEEPVIGDVQDDLLDTFRDVKSGLIAFEQGHAQEAAWRWASNHQVHWGRHATAAVFALHCLYQPREAANAA